MADPIVNFFKSTLVGTYSNTDTSFTIATGDGALLPDPSTDGEFNLVVYEGTAGISASAFEIVRVTGKSGDVLTVTREQEGTTALTIGAIAHSIIMSATKKTFDDINTSIENVDLTSLSNVESITYDSTGDEVFQLPSGTTAQRPVSPSIGYTRLNTDTGDFECFSGNIWARLAFDNVYKAQSAQANSQAISFTVRETKKSETVLAGANAQALDATTKQTQTSEMITANASAEALIADFVSLIDVEYLVIAGGGSGASNEAGGGGAGGYRSSVTGESSGGGTSAESPFKMAAGTDYNITIGAGGAATGSAIYGYPGSASSLGTISSVGGGYGAGKNRTGGNGGSGGGGGRSRESGAGTAGQGFAGGSASTDRGCGGGGAGQTGQAINGGNGVSSSITGVSVIRAGGGGGSDNDPPTAGTGGAGGGGDASVTSGVQATSGSVNTGGGGGAHSVFLQLSGAGGSGIVIIRYPSSYTITVGAGLTSSTSTIGSNKVTTFTAGTGIISIA